MGNVAVDLREKQTDISTSVEVESTSVEVKEKKQIEFNIKTNLVTGLLMGAFSAYMIYVLPVQVREPAYNSGAPSPRIIPSMVLWGILICAVCMIFQSLVLKKEKIFTFKLSQELPAIIVITLLCIFTFLIINVGFVLAIVIVFPPMLFYLGERKPLIYIFTLVAGICIYFLFREVLNISLPGFPGFGG